MKAIGVLGAAVLALIAVSAQAAPAAIAKLKNVTGTVLVTQGDAMVAAADGHALPSGARIVTTMGSVVTVSFDKGCEVTLRENQRLSIREYGNCAQLAAAVEGTGVARTSAMARFLGSGDMVAQNVIGGETGLTGTQMVILGLAGGGVGYAIYDANKSSGSVSPF